MPNITQERYKMIVMVKDTGGDNGPGHVSVSLIKEEVGSGAEIRHTSYYPSLLGSLVNGITLGSVVVDSQLASSHEEDLDEATHVYEKHLTAEEYQEATAEQDHLAQGIRDGNCVYAVFGDVNPIAAFMTHVIDGYRHFEEAAKNHVSNNCPSTMLDNYLGFSDIPWSEEVADSRTPVTIENCASTVARIVRKTSQFDNPLIPSFFNDKLPSAGFTKVPKEQFDKFPQQDLQTEESLIEAEDFKPLAPLKAVAEKAQTFAEPAEDDGFSLRI